MRTYARGLVVAMGNVVCMVSRLLRAFDTHTDSMGTYSLDVVVGCYVSPQIYGYSEVIRLSLLSSFRLYRYSRVIESNLLFSLLR